MHSDAKSAIKSLVLDLRKNLEDEIAIQLKRYGFAGERWLPVERLPHIHNDDAATRDYYRLKAALEQHLRRIGVTPEAAKPKQRAEAVDWFVREVAFTHLNRLAALKVLEVRGLIPEIVTTREAYGGRSRAHYDYRNAHPEAAARPDDGLPDAIRHACRRVYTEFKFLFEVGDPAEDREPPANTILWPSYPELKTCIDLINGLDAAAGVTEGTLWAEDEIIGWLYQFYNAEHKKAVRDRGRPRHPAEVAVINQFFTPRWIVKFLVDNTLGRLWLEMHPDSGRVRAKCDYLVPEPLPEDEEGSHSRRDDDAITLDPDSPVNSPHAPARREAKPVTEIRLIDPACGTMHFGHYAFEVFQTMYLDSLDHGWPIFPSPDHRERGPEGEGDIPVLILRHNLYGVDIDLRAVQLAALSLFVKAKRANPDAHITGVNLVVADAVLPQDGARRAFLEQYADNRKVQDAVRTVLEEMENVAEVGSLLRVEERLRDLLAEAGARVEGLDPAQGRLPGTAAPRRQLGLYEAGGADPEEWGAHYTLERLLADLRAFAARALRTHDLNAQIFAQEAQKTVHLLDVFLNDYDAVVMNPPYGETTKEAKNYLSKAYPFSHYDLATAFKARASDWLSLEGYLGALTPRSYLFLSRYKNFRLNILLRNYELVGLLELGIGALDDASVRVAASILHRHDNPSSEVQGVFFRLDDVSSKKREFEISYKEWIELGKYPRVFSRKMAKFEVIPGNPLSYWLPEIVFDRFEELESLEPTLGVIRCGLSTSNDARFLRYFWEVRSEQIGQGKKWVPYAKGGDYSPYYSDHNLVVLWDNSGEEIKAFSRSIVPNRELYFQEGMCYSLVNEQGINAQWLPPNHIFALTGPSFFAHNGHSFWYVMGLLNSNLALLCARSLTPNKDLSPGYIASIPVYSSLNDDTDSIASSSRMSCELKRHWNIASEISTNFTQPWLLQLARPESDVFAKGVGRVLALLGDDAPEIALPEPVTLSALLDVIRAIEQAADARLQRLQVEIDEAVYDLYEISREDRALIERELGDRPPELVWPQRERASDKEKRREHVRRLLSYFVLQALKEKRDGLLPLCPGTGQETALDAVRRGLERAFGEEAAFCMETEAQQILGRDIGDWLDGPFIKWHTKLYKKRPVIWQLSSRDYYHIFNIFLYVHALDRDTLRKVQTQYLWARRRTLVSERDAAQSNEEYDRVADTEEDLEALEAFEAKLLSVIEGDVKVRTPTWAEGPYRQGVYDPVLDDGVQVNIAPLQKAYLLRYKRMV